MALFDLHHPWVFTFGVLGNIVSLLVFLAPVPTFIRIYKAKSTLGYQSVPYVVSLFSAMLWMYYAFLKKTAPLLITINSIGCVIETLYISIFLGYASKTARRQTMKMLLLLVGGLYSVIVLGTMFPFKGALRVAIVGWICVAFSVCVFAAPLSIVFKVVKTKSVEFMPFNLSFFLTLTAVMWLGYGLLLKDMCIALPNVLGFLLGIVQMVLYGIYRNKKPVEVAEEKKSAVPELVINVAGLGELLHSTVEDSKTTAITSSSEETENNNNDEDRSKEVGDNVQHLTKIIESRIAKYDNGNLSSGESRTKIGKMTEEESFFYEAVTRLSKLTEFPSSGSQNQQTSSVLQRAMAFLEEEFRIILEDSVQDDVAVKRDDGGALEESPPPQEEYQPYPPDVVTRMNRIANVMLSGGYETECCQIFHKHANPNSVRNGETSDTTARPTSLFSAQEMLETLISIALMLSGVANVTGWL
nr:bidirectional sugar transporter N3-like [Ipomoea trifida]